MINEEKICQGEYRKKPCNKEAVYNAPLEDCIYCKRCYENRLKTISKLRNTFETNFRKAYNKRNLYNMYMIYKNWKQDPFSKTFSFFCFENFRSSFDKLLHLPDEDIPYVLTVPVEEVCNWYNIEMREKIIERQVVYSIKPKCKNCHCYMDNQPLKSSGLPYKTCLRCRLRGKKKELKQEENSLNE